MNGFLLQFRVTTVDQWGQTVSHSQPQQGALKSTVIISVTLLLLNNNNNNNNNNTSNKHSICTISEKHHEATN
jgi:hypothetical protein